MQKLSSGKFRVYPPSWRAFFVHQIFSIAQNLAWLGLYEGAVERALFVSHVLVTILVVVGFFSCFVLVQKSLDGKT